MLLRFYARAGFVEPDPRFPRGHGQPWRRIGRDLTGKATAEPAEFAADSSEGRRVLKTMTRESDAERRAVVAPLIPADAATAQACGLPFVPVEQGPDGEWQPKQARKADTK
jgi:hypothetical protein